MSNRIFSKLKSQTGSMAVYVLVVLLTFLIILVIVYSQIMLARRTQLSTDLKVKDAYEKDYLKANLVYSEQLKKYVTKGLIAQFDGTNNTGDGHNSSASRWENLIGDNNNGTFHGTTIRDNYVAFDGVDDWVNLGEIKGNSAITLEITVRINELGKTHALLGNWESGGGGLAVSPTGTFYFQEYIKKTDNSSAYQGPTSSDVLSTNQIYHIVGTYDGKIFKLYLNGQLNKSLAIEGTIVDPTNNEMALGTNINKMQSNTDYANMNLYSCRIYNRALTEEEVQHNYNADKINYFVYADQLKNYVPNGLILHYDGINNTGSGHDAKATTWKDLSGNNNDGELKNFGNVTGSGWADSGLVLDGNDDGVYLGNKLIDLYKNNATIEMVVNLAFEATDTFDIFLGNYNTQPGINIERSNTSKGRWWYNNGSVSQITTEDVYEGNKTILVQFLLDKENHKITFSVNGKEKASITHANYTGSYNFANAWIGRDQVTTNNRSLKGTISSVRIYNRLLAPDEVQHNYNVDKLNYIKN